MNQEQIVDGVIADYLESKFVGVKDKLGKTPKYFKRGAKASIMGNDRRIYELIKSLEEKNNTDEYLTYFDELVNAYRKYVEVADCEVKEFGEVMTPITLVEEMLDKLPNDVWSNPNLKWLDPCAGVGTFPSIVVQRLMKGLETFERNPIKRYRHIIEEMIYVCELQPKNLFVYHCVFDKDDTNELNTYCGSFLDENFDKHMSNVWGVEKFDIIIGNPPYNDGSNNRGSAHVLWDKFVVKTLNDILKEGGYLNFVHPSGWRNVDGGFKKTQRIMLSKTFIYLSINSSQEGQKIFGATTNFDYYCLLNVKNDNNIKTKIKCIDGTIEEYCLNNIEFVPNGMFDYIFSLVANDNEEKVKVIEDCSYHHQKKYISPIQNDEFKYPCIYSIKKGSIPTFKYSSCNDKGHFGVKKIIFGNGANPTYMKDECGEYAMTQFAFAVYGYDLDIIEKSIQSSGIKKITEMTKFVSTAGNPIIYPKIISLFRKDFWKQFLND